MVFQMRGGGQTSSNWRTVGCCRGNIATQNSEQTTLVGIFKLDKLRADIPLLVMIELAEIYRSPVLCKRAHIDNKLPKIVIVKNPSI